MMVIRRIREHVAGHNWFAVGVDLAIVVIGVFLGLQANNWNQQRLDAAQGRIYRAMLIDDLTDNRQNLAMRIAYYGEVRAASLATLGRLERADGDFGEIFLVDAYQASQILPWALKRTTYDQIMSVGAMANLGSQKVQDQIANYFVGAEIAGANLAPASPYREIVRRVLPYAVQQRIRTACPEVIRADARGASHLVLVGNCRPGLDTALVRQAAAKLRSTPGIVDDLTRSIVDIDLKLSSLARVANRAAALQRTLEAES
jgi:hypothetical protein